MKNNLTINIKIWDYWLMLKGKVYVLLEIAGKLRLLTYQIINVRKDEKNR